MPTIRIATFQLGRLDEAKLANRRVSDVLVHLFPRFDLIALQGVRGKNRGVLVRLVEQMGAASGRSYDFATCPTQQRDALEHYSAFLFDRGRIDVDRRMVHFVEDPRGRFRVKPLVGSFRVRGPDPAEAFTFTLINVETDPDHAAAELDLLAEAFARCGTPTPTKTTLSCWATWRATISTWDNWASCWASRRCCRACPARFAAPICWTTSCWTDGRPPSSPAGWKPWT